MSRPWIWAMLVGAGACAPARMELPAPLADTPALAVSGRQGWQLNQVVRFGEFTVTGIERSWVKGSGLRAGVPDIQLDLARARQTYRFTLAAAGTGETWTGECRTVFRRAGVDLKGVDIDPKDTSRLDCTLVAGDQPAATLAMRESYDRPLRGVLAGTGDDTVEVTGTGRMQGSVPVANFTSGYEARRGGTVLAAVEVINDGAVWLGRGLASAERGRMAAMATALLLREDLRAALERSEEAMR